jgi:predicted SprT family Zn-dependent metalloprotease
VIPFFYQQKRIKEMNKVQLVTKFAKDKMKEHNLTSWKFELGSAKSTAGTCYTSRKLIRMSRVLIDARSLEDSYNTVLHEIAHALTPGHGHDRTWKRMAVQVGAKPERCYNSSEVEKNKIQYKYTLRCPNGHEYGASRRLKRRKSCGKCCNHFNPQFELKVIQNY